MTHTAKEITPIASNTPGRMKEKMWVEEPFSDESTATPRSTTAVTMIIIDTSAIGQHFRETDTSITDGPNEDDLDSFAMSRCSDRGKEMNIVTRTMIKCRSTSHLNT